jgi:protein-S-isoprenylcysteine O-methyltransferase Ste14
MPLAAPVVVLHDGWLWGESLLLAGVLVPAQLLFRWTRDARNLAGRAALQMATFTALVFWLLPASVFAVRGGSFAALDVRGDLGASVQLQIALLPALLGLSAVQEFFERGRGTPFPYDPPHRLVTSGLFAYVRGPMQLSVALALPAWGWLLGSGWLVAAGGVALVFATGFAAWHEDTELELRFGRDWTEYRRAVSLWPRWRPWIPRPSRLYYGAGCGPCEELAGWVRRLGPSALEFVPAQQHPMRELERLTYTHPDGREEEGVAALARALEHVNLAWAMAGCLLRLPGFRHGVQLMVDASGGGRRAIPLTHEQIL